MSSRDAPAQPFTPKSQRVSTQATNAIQKNTSEIVVSRAPARFDRRGVRRRRVHPQREHRGPPVAVTQPDAGHDEQWKPQRRDNPRRHRHRPNGFARRPCGCDRPPASRSLHRPSGSRCRAASTQSPTGRGTHARQPSRSSMRTHRSPTPAARPPAPRHPESAASIASPDVATLANSQPPRARSRSPIHR